MKITLLISQNCPACERARTALSDFKYDGRKLIFAIIDIQDTSEIAVPIVPALYVNDKLFSYGDIDKEKLTKYMAGI